MDSFQNAGLNGYFLVSKSDEAAEILQLRYGVAIVTSCDSYVVAAGYTLSRENSANL